MLFVSVFKDLRQVETERNIIPTTWNEQGQNVVCSVHKAYNGLLKKHINQYFNHLPFIFICSNRSVNCSAQLVFSYIVSVAIKILSKRITETQTNNSDQDQAPVGEECIIILHHGSKISIVITAAQWFLLVPAAKIFFFCFVFDRYFFVYICISPLIENTRRVFPPL